MIIKQLPPPTNQSSGKGGRLREFDALRGFSMLSVVYMHVLLGADIGSFSTISGTFVMGYFMPLFFFISGFFSYKPLYKWNITTIFRQLSQRSKALLISSIVFYALLSYCHGGDIIGWIHQGFKWYWFTPVLFEMYLLFIIAVSISLLLKREISIVLMIGITLVLLIVKDCTILNEAIWWKVVNGSALCYFIQWFVFGLIVRRYYSKTLNLLDIKGVKAILITGYVAIMCFLSSDVSEGLPSVKTIASLAVSYVGIMLLYMLFYQARKYFDGNNYIGNGLCIIGQRTLDIYMIHYFFVPVLPAIGSWLAPNTMVLFQLMYGLGTAVIISIISLTISWCIRTSPVLADWFFGVRQ